MGEQEEDGREIWRAPFSPTLKGGPARALLPRLPASYSPSLPGPARLSCPSRVAADGFRPVHSSWGVRRYSARDPGPPGPTPTVHKDAADGASVPPEPRSPGPLQPQGHGRLRTSPPCCGRDIRRTREPLPALPDAFACPYPRYPLPGALKAFDHLPSPALPGPLIAPAARRRPPPPRPRPRLPSPAPAHAAPPPSVHRPRPARSPPAAAAVAASATPPRARPAPARPADP